MYQTPALSVVEIEAAQMMANSYVREVSSNETKISWRSVPGYDVAALALSVGGGGHVAASGATIRCGLEEAIPQILAITKKMIEESSAR